MTEKRVSQNAIATEVGKIDLQLISMRQNLCSVLRINVSVQGLFVLIGGLEGSRFDGLAVNGQRNVVFHANTIKVKISAPDGDVIWKGRKPDRGIQFESNQGSGSMEIPLERYSPRIRREVKGRKGKTVTTLSGFDLVNNSLSDISKQLKQHCGTGGSVKDGVVIIQGDHRDTIKSLLEGQGYTVKFSGG